MKKILFIGLGSIGQRHLRNAQKIFKNYEFYALRKTNHNLIIKDAKLIKKKSIEKEFNLKKIFNKTADAIKLKPNIVFVCNPTSKHLDESIKFSKIGCHLFIEKPLGTSKVKLNKLVSFLKNKKLVSIVGYQNRFNPAIQYIKKSIKNRKYGRVISSKFNFLTYLPNHHKYENYKTSYVSQKKLGGGTALNLSHEIDLIYYFFGMPKKIINHNLNPKIIKTQTECDIYSTLIFKNNSIAQLNLSYSSFLDEHFIQIKFSKCILIFNFSSGKITIFGKNGVKEKNYKISRNKIFLEELKFFKKAISTKKLNHSLSVQKQIDVFNLINKIR